MVPPALRASRFYTIAAPAVRSEMIWTVGHISIMLYVYACRFDVETAQARARSGRYEIITVETTAKLPEPRVSKITVDWRKYYLSSNKNGDDLMF